MRDGLVGNVLDAFQKMIVHIPASLCAAPMLLGWLAEMIADVIVGRLQDKNHKPMTQEQCIRIAINDYKLHASNMACNAPPTSNKPAVLAFDDGRRGLKRCASSQRKKKKIGSELLAAQATPHELLWIQRVEHFINLLG